jgi:hypothetical protein
MTHNRRQFGASLILSSAALLAAPGRLVAQDDGGASAAPQSGPLADPHPANVFFSPSGRPYRARQGDPYPVTNWFHMADANGDGKIDHAEFLADAESFFKVLDRNGDGVISPQEVQFYEQRIAPEVLGNRVQGTRFGYVVSVQPRLWLTQGPGVGLPGSGGVYHPDGATGPAGSVDPNTIDSGPDERNKSMPYDASGAGASPYGFFDEPEPVTAADVRFRGLISRADFLKLADIHFSTLDAASVGYLTLDSLPMTPVQKKLERGGRHRRVARSSGA